MKKYILGMVALLGFCASSALAELTTEFFIQGGKPVNMMAGNYKEKNDRVWMLQKKNGQQPPEWAGMSLGRGNNIVELEMLFYRRSDLYGKRIPSEAAVHFGKHTLVLDGADGYILLCEEGKEGVKVGKASKFITMKKIFKLKIARINGELIIKINNKEAGRYNVKKDKGDAIGKIGIDCAKSVIQIDNFSARSSSFTAATE